MKAKTIKNLKIKVKQYLQDHPEMRDGQAFFNVLNELDKNVADKIRGSEKDCFYHDYKILDFLKTVKEEWKRKEIDFSWNEAIQKIYGDHQEEKPVSEKQIELTDKQKLDKIEKTIEKWFLRDTHFKNDGFKAEEFFDSKEEAYKGGCGDGKFDISSTIMKIINNW